MRPGPRLVPALVFALATGIATARGGGMPDTQLLRQAWEDMRLGRWNAAEEDLASITPPVARPTDPETAAEALYARGNLWLYRKPAADPARAREAFAELTRRFPSHPLAAWAALAVARMPELDVLRPDPAAAAKLYLGVMEAYPSSPAAGEAALHRALALAASGAATDARNAALELEAWWTRNPHPSLACAYESTLGRLWRFPLNDPRRAVEHLRKALDLRPASLSHRQGICWTIARLADEDLRDKALAIHYYTRFAKEFPRHPNVYNAMQALKRLGAPLPAVEDYSLEGLRARQAEDPR